MALFSVEAEWEYQTASNTPPADPAAEVVPTGSWLGPAAAPFGTLGTFVTDKPINTAWAVDVGLWLRRNVVTDGKAPVLLQGQIENHCYVYWDGTYIGAVNPGAASRTDVPEFQIVVPKALATSGTHQVALLCQDEATSGAGDTTYVYLTADYLPAIMSLQPASPVRETLAWLTDVIISEDGTEDRVQVRAIPRQSYGLNYPANALDQAQVFNTVYGARAKQWGVPVWTQGTHLGAVVADALSLAVDPDYAEYRPNSLAIIWQSTNQWQVVGIDLVNADTLSLTTVTEAFTDAWVMPLRMARLTSNPKKTFNGYNSQYDFNFEVDDNEELTVAAPTQYLGNDIYYDEELLDGDSATDDIITKMDVQDEDLGMVEYSTPWAFNRIARVHRVVAETKAEAWAMRQWFHRRGGRFRAFWQPSFEMDMVLLSTGAITNVITVRSDEYRRWASARTHIALLINGTWTSRAILSSLQVDEDQVQLTLSSSLATNASNIKQISYLGLKRLDTDRVEIQWVGGGVCQTETRMIEIEP